MANKLLDIFSGISRWEWIAYAAAVLTSLVMESMK